MLAWDRTGRWLWASGKTTNLCETGMTPIRLQPTSNSFINNIGRDVYDDNYRVDNFPNTAKHQASAAQDTRDLWCWRVLIATLPYSLRMCLSLLSLFFLPPFSLSPFLSLSLHLPHLLFLTCARLLFAFCLCISLDLPYWWMKEPCPWWDMDFPSLGLTLMSL